MRHFKLLAVLAWALILSAGLLSPQRNAVRARSPRQEGTPTATIAVVPIVVSTPRPDGSIIHVVQSGQFLTNIALAYGIPLQDVLNLNGLTEQSVIFPGEILLIRLPSTLLPNTSATPATATPGATASASAAATGAVTPAAGASGTPLPEQQASATPRPAEPTFTATQAAATLAPATESAAPEASAPPSPVETELAAPQPRQESGGPDFLLIAVLILGATGTALVVLGSALKRNV